MVKHRCSGLSYNRYFVIADWPLYSIHDDCIPSTKQWLCVWWKQETGSERYNYMKAEAVGLGSCKLRPGARVFRIFAKINLMFFIYLLNSDGHYTK